MPIASRGGVYRSAPSHRADEPWLERSEERENGPFAKPVVAVHVVWNDALIGSAHLSHDDDFDPWLDLARDGAHGCAVKIRAGRARFVFAPDPRSAVEGPNGSLSFESLVDEQLVEPMHDGSFTIAMEPGLVYRTVRNDIRRDRRDRRRATTARSTAAAREVRDLSFARDHGACARRRPTGSESHGRRTNRAASTRRRARTARCIARTRCNGTSSTRTSRAVRPSAPAAGRGLPRRRLHAIIVLVPRAIAAQRRPVAVGVARRGSVALAGGWSAFVDVGMDLGVRRAHAAHASLPYAACVLVRRRASTQRRDARGESPGHADSLPGERASTHDHCDGSLRHRAGWIGDGRGRDVDERSCSGGCEAGEGLGVPVAGGWNVRVRDLFVSNRRAPSLRACVVLTPPDGQCAPRRRP